MKKLAAFLVLAAFLAQPAFAAKAKKTFLPFKGSYSGTAFTSFSGSPGTATANAVISVPKNGKTATITLSGFMTFSGSTIPLAGTIVLANGSASVSNQSLGLGSPTQYPGIGSYVINSPKKFTFTSAGSSLAVNGTVSVKPNGKKKQTLTITFLMTAFGSPYNFIFTLKGKAPKPVEK
jgi:hypothetical protein